MLYSNLHRDLAFRQVTDYAVQLQTHFIHRGDRTAASTEAKAGGVFISNSWCRDVKTVYKHCLPDVEFLQLRCCPYYLPQEFTAVSLAAVYCIYTIYNIQYNIYINLTEQFGAGSSVQKLTHKIYH